MRVGGLDVATTSGWSVIDGDLIRAGKFVCDGDSEGQKLWSFLIWVRQWILTERIDFVGIESQVVVARGRRVKADGGDLFGGEKTAENMTNPKTQARLSTLNNAAQAACESLSVPWVHVAPATHRKAFLGSGRHPKGTAKDRTLAQCRALGVQIKSKDAADAVSIAWWAAGYCKQHMVKPGDLFGGQGALDTGNGQDSSRAGR